MLAFLRQLGAAAEISYLSQAHYLQLREESPINCVCVWIFSGEGELGGKAGEMLGEAEDGGDVVDRGDGEGDGDGGAKWQHEAVGEDFGDGEDENV